MESRKYAETCSGQAYSVRAKSFEGAGESPYVQALHTLRHLDHTKFDFSTSDLKCINYQQQKPQNSRSRLPKQTA